MADVGGLPSGDVTFVFTDIEGSTRLMRRLGDRYSDTSERHIEVMHQAWDEHGGHVVSSAGDSVFVAFADAADAVRACARAQQLLRAERWPDATELKVRMGVHSGLAAPRSGDYTALAVNQAARVMSAAHGGQVLVSDDTVRRLVAPRDVGLVPVGRYRIRDFDEPVPLFSLASNGETADLSAVRALPADGHNLLAPATRLFGRDDTIAEVLDLIEPRRVVCLVGPGGTGKTRLATETGLRFAEQWPHGVWMIELAPVRDAALIAGAVKAGVDAPSSTGDAWKDVLEHLRAQQALLIFDNCEHLLHDVSRLVDELLVACPGCAALATSREPLGIARETAFRLPPLDPASAAELFADRARAAGRSVDVDATVTEICRRLDGLPLAIELAAARVGVLQPVDVLQGLDDRFRLLRTRSAVVPERHQTLEALLEWDEQLLTPPERVCLHRLGIFGGSFTVHAATAAAGFGTVDRLDVPELVWSLAEKSLVVADPAANETRFRLLESVRAFALQQLDPDDRDRAVDALADWYLARVGPAQRFARQWSSEVQADLDNLRGIIGPLASVAPERAQELAYVIARHVDRAHSSRAAVDELTKHLQLLPEQTSTRISLLTTLADVNLHLRNVEAAERAVEAAEALYAAIGELPEWDDVAIVRTRGEIAVRRGDSDEAIAAARHALEGELSLRGRARMSSQLGIAAHEIGDLELAREAFQQEYESYRALGDEGTEASAAGNLAEVEMGLGHWAEAARHQRVCLEGALEIGAPLLVALSLVLAARLAETAGELVTAVTLHGHADVLLETTGFTMYDSDRRVSDEMLKRAEEQLGTDAFDEALAAGRALDVTEAAAIADDVLRAAQ